MINYLLGDYINRIKVGYVKGLLNLEVEYSKMCLVVTKLLLKYSYLKNFSLITDNKKKRIKVFLSYLGPKRKPSLISARLVSKPSLKVYITYKQLYRLLKKNINLLLISTSRAGIISGEDCLKLKIGGEFLLELL